MRIGDVLAHQEIGCSLLRPRHPGVCMLDLLGLAITLGLLATYPQKFVFAVLPGSIALLYAVSCVYHWFPVNGVRQKADYFMIAVVIAATYMPFWGNRDVLPTSIADPRLALLGAIFLGTCTTRLSPWRSVERVGGFLYLVLGLFGTVVSFNELPHWISLPGAVMFQTGSVLYFVQFLVYAAKRPNPWPGRFSYREVQHIVLLVATTPHSWIVLTHL